MESTQVVRRESWGAVCCQQCWPLQSWAVLCNGGSWAVIGSGGNADKWWVGSNGRCKAPTHSRCQSAWVVLQLVKV
jgi:hypothetical protein